MARPPTICTDAILTVARRLFTERGTDVPTAEIARAAGVSEGSIFRRFPTKRALFLAAIGVNGAPAWVVELASLPGDDPQQELQAIALKVLDFHRDLLPRMMLLWSAKPALLREVHQGAASPARQGVAGLADYLDRLMRAGRIRMTHPEIVARTLLGALHNYTFFETMGIEVRGPLDAATFVRSLIDTLWRGIAPDGEGASR